MQRETESPPLPCLLLDMTQICAVLGLSKPVIYDLIETEKLRTFLIGNRRFSTPALVQECIDALATEGGAPLPSQRPNNRHRPVVQKSKRAASARGARS